MDKYSIVFSSTGARTVFFQMPESDPPKMRVRPHRFELLHHSLIAAKYIFTRRPRRRPCGHRGAWRRGCPSWAAGSGGGRSRGQRPPRGHQRGSRAGRSCWQHPCRSCSTHAGQYHVLYSHWQAWRNHLPIHAHVAKTWSRHVNGSSAWRTGNRKAFLLAGGGLGAVGDGDLVLGGLLGVVGLLGGNGDATVLSGLDTDGLEETENG